MSSFLESMSFQRLFGVPRKRSFPRIHWLSWVVPLMAVLGTLAYIFAASKGYTTEVTLPGFAGEPQTALQRFEDEYLDDLSRYLVEQFHRELDEVNKKVQESLDANNRLYSEEHIRKLAQEELEKQRPKNVGVDYASVFSGCKIVEHSPTHSFGSETTTVMYIPLYKNDREPELILNRVALTPGYCWPFKGSSGYVIMQLEEAVRINEVVYTHVDRATETANLARGAPQTIEAWGGVEVDHMKFLGEVQLNDDQSTASIVVDQPRVAKYIKFIVTKNNGADFTCLYRVSVFANSTATE
ncbi:SUN domain-containing protein [Aphelenchoides bicaudatus]|nr:SUN domain-containing protein [Aphelenchoides bicaudatus]